MQIINEFYYCDCVRHPNVKIWKHIGISPLTKKKVTPKGSAVNGPLLLCTNSPCIESKKHRKLAFESKESLLIMTDQSSLTLYFPMSQNVQTRFKNLAAFAK